MSDTEPIMWQRRPAAAPIQRLPITCQRLPAATPLWQRRPAAAPDLQPSSVQIGYFDPEAPIQCLSGDLPHWRQPGVTYFITFRQADSLPREKLQQWRQEQQQWLAAHPPPHDLAARLDYYHRFPQRLQEWLDSGFGSCILAHPAPKRILADALAHFAGTRYGLDRFVVAANHVHVLVTPLAGYSLSSILHSWKSFTAHQIVRSLNHLPPTHRPTKLQSRDGSATFWQKESFDHIVRSPTSLEKFRQYIDAHQSARGIPPR